MPEILQIQSTDKNIEHEGTKTPIKGYDWDEIDEIDVENPFELETVRNARRAHTLLHWGWNDQALPDWTYDEMIAEHSRVVQFLLDRGERHVRRTSLDTTLPEGLRNRSFNPEKNLTYLRTLSHYHRETLESIGIDTVRKLSKSDPEEVSEKTDLKPSYVEYLQEQAEKL